MRFAEQLQENVAIALDTLRVSKLRSALTILGVVIGVSTVMAMAAIVQGIRDQVVHTIEVAGPTTFYVIKKFSQTPLNPTSCPRRSASGPTCPPKRPSESPHCPRSRTRRSGRRPSAR